MDHAGLAGHDAADDDRGRGRPEQCGALGGAAAQGRGQQRYGQVRQDRLGAEAGVDRAGAVAAAAIEPGGQPGDRDLGEPAQRREPGDGPGAKNAGRAATSSSAIQRSCAQLLGGDQGERRHQGEHDDAGGHRERVDTHGDAGRGWHVTDRSRTWSDGPSAIRCDGSTGPRCGPVARISAGTR